MVVHLRRSLGDIASWFRPHNEHFVLLHVVAYRLLVEMFGIGSYLPFQLALIGTHVAAVSAVFVLVDRHGGRERLPLLPPSCSSSAGGSLNLFWAFQNRIRRCRLRSGCGHSSSCRLGPPSPRLS